MPEHDARQASLWRDLRWIADFIDTEYPDENCPDHPSATLRRYAERLRQIAEVCSKPSERDRKGARVELSAVDIEQEFHCLSSEATEFLDDNADKIRNAMMEAGWQTIREVCVVERCSRRD